LLDAVAKDEVELGFAPVTEILSDARVELVGPVPSALQEMTELTAAVIAASVDGDRARAFIDFLADDAAKVVLERQGLERA
jgi:molybdate transport system substrate-binding protein